MSDFEIKTQILKDIDSLPADALRELQAIVKHYVVKAQAKKKRQFGCMSGLVIYMAPDFNAPIEDFKDYM